MQQNIYGHFDDEQREFVITTPSTPFPWINYLGNEKFFGLISNTAGGYDFYADAKFRRITRYRYNSVPLDSGGRYFYINDEGTVWNPGWKPCKTTLDSYECRHGMNYTRITGAKNGIEASVLFFVPQGVNAELHKVTLKNLTNKTKTIKFFSFAEWCLWNAAADMENFQRTLSTGEVEIDGATIYHKTEYKERRNHYAFYALTNAAIDGFDTDRDAFLGMYNGYDAPQCVMQGKSAGSVAHGWNPIASHYINIELAPGESRDLIFVLGYAENEQAFKFSQADIARKQSGELISSQASDVTLINKTKAQEIIARFSTVEAVDQAFAQLREFWDRLLSTYTVNSGEARLDRMVNVWNQYQCMITFCFSRSASYFESGIGRGMGFRDSNQDLVGFVHLVPELARQRILDIAATQHADGSCYHQYQPLTKRGNNDIGGGFNDDPLWLIFGTVAYLKETGDFTILDEPVAWDNQPGSEVPLMEHLRVSFDHVINNLGPHRLPLIGRADWNDCLNLNCFSWNPDESFQTTENRTEGSKAESLMIAGLFVVSGRQYADLCHYIATQAANSALEREAERAIAQVNAMVDAIEQHGWDGEWFLRAYDFAGNKIGSHENEEGKIFIESQGWCAMASVGSEKGMTFKALDSCKRYLDTEHGMVLNNPAFTTYHVEMGEISTYPAGYKENAGIFCHNNPWIVIGETMASRGNDAWEHYTKICPAWITNQELHKVEPYIYCQMIAGKDAAVPGEGKNSWLTGTAAWNWLAVSQHILGIRPTFNGLEIDPCIPASMSEFTVRRLFRGAEFLITVRNPEHRERGIKCITVDGEPIEGNIINATQGKHIIDVLM